MLITFLQYEVKTIFTNAFSWITPLLFFILVVVLFPLSITPNPVLLNKIAPGIIWIAALLSILISINQLFQNDQESGYLDLLFLSDYPLIVLVSIKILSHWLTHCLPLIFISPLLGLLLNFTGQEEWVLIITLLLGTPVLCMLGAIGAALVVGLRGNGLLLPILIMPFYIPILIFGTGTLMAAESQNLIGYFAIMGALLLITITFAPFFTSLALKIGVDH